MRQRTLSNRSRRCGQTASTPQLPAILISVARYVECAGVFSIESGDLLEGALPRRQQRLVQAWIELHRDELMADWSRAIEGEELFKIDR